MAAYRFEHGGDRFTLLDTPGFDDNTMSNDEVTGRIVRWLESSYREGTRLSGIVYLHNITKTRLQGSAFQNIRMFRRLCGDDALKNVVLATSFWDQVDSSVGEDRERELIKSKDFWGPLVSKGSSVVRIAPDRATCLRVLEPMARNRKMTLLVQRELVDEKKNLADTTVGKDSTAAQAAKVEKKLAKQRKKETKKMKEDLRKSEKAHKREADRVRKKQESLANAERKRLKQAEKEHQRDVRREKRRRDRERAAIEAERRRVEREAERRAEAQAAEQERIRRAQEAERQRIQWQQEAEQYRREQARRRQLEEDLYWNCRCQQYYWNGRWHHHRCSYCKWRWP